MARSDHWINEAYEKLLPRNCPVIERTGDGDPCGVCCYYLEDGYTCPRHGIVKDVDLATRIDNFLIKHGVDLEEIDREIDAMINVRIALAQLKPDR